MLDARSVDFDLEKLVHTDSKRRELITKTDELRKKKNQVSIQIAQQKKEGKDASSLLSEMRSVSSELAELETLQINNEAEYTRLASSIPNLIDDSVPKFLGKFTLSGSKAFLMVLAFSFEILLSIT